MVKKRQLVAKGPARRDDEGRLLCNIAGDCAEVAVIQATYDCDDCDTHRAELQARIDMKKQTRDEHQAALDVLRDRLEREQRPPDAAEMAIAALGQSQLQRVGADLEALEAATARHDGQHTHPLYGCDTHGRQAGVITD